MKRLRQLLVLFGFTILLGACAQHEFCSENCSKPTETPTINRMTMKVFEKQDVYLMPKGDTLKIILPTDQFFRFNSPTIKNDKKATLNQVADLLQLYGQTASVKIVGYTDAVASPGYSQRLSEMRAQAILSYFWSRGLDAEHLYAVGQGQQNLVASSNDVMANGANRRIEIIVHAHCTSCL